ncbi:MAG: hypothetical protein COB67_08515 [SAR324 cluster bacterium]|uniref:Uncharacterized protein n=1 Tax=SAR324 cluster bacterium TaxID=2024889 RepID=A0A2A4T1L8_9DELT|nr:MAG: hypothetical protein COB67_08515 [SAR324 cluster bacterium]
MDKKDRVLEYFDQNPESTPEELVAVIPDISLQAARNFWTLWKKLAAWKYAQGMEEDNLAKLAPRQKKKKKTLEQQKLPQSGLGPANSQIQRAPANAPVDGMSFSSLPFSSFQLDFLHYLVEKRDILKTIIEQKQAIPTPSSGLQAVDPDVMSLFEQACHKAGLTQSQGLNIALRDFIQRFS